MLQRTVVRGIFHAGVGSMLAACLLLCNKPIFVSLLAAATAAFLCLDIVRLRVASLRQRFAKWFASMLRKDEEDRLTGSSYFLIGSLATVLLFPTEMTLPAILYLSLGDPTASIIGTWRGHRKLWGKTLEGHLAFVSICTFIAIAITFFKVLPLSVALTGALFATVVQALPLPVNDNLTIPIVSAGAMFTAHTFL